jgi:GTPase
MSAVDKHYSDAQMAVEKSLAEMVRCSDKEKDALRQHFEGLRQMATKLASGRVDIVVFGEIKTGKSSLINAFVGGQVAKVDVVVCTRAVDGWRWKELNYRLPGFASSEVRLIDTPGINEIDGAERAAMARDAANQADLILFLTDSDLNEIECSALRELRASGRPIIMVINKADLYSKDEREKLRNKFIEELHGVIGPSDVVEAQADPREVEYIIVQPNGEEVSEKRKPRPKIEAVQNRILEILEKDGKVLVALNASLFAADTSEYIASVKVKMRNKAAEATIYSYAAVKGVTVAVNPIPIGDVLGGTAVDATMVVHLGRLYGIEMTTAEAWELVKSIAAAASAMAAIDTLLSVAAGLLAVGSAGLSLFVTVPSQALTAAFGSYVVGQTSKRYFEMGSSWGKGGPKSVVKDILDHTDEKSVMAKLRETIDEILKSNRHASQKPSWTMPFTG